MDLSQIAAVTGKSGLYKVVSPTRSGVILESMDEAKKKMVASINNKVSILSDISIYTTDEEGATPLSEVMMKIHQEFEGDTDLTSSSSTDELKSFLKFILPEYDESRVYVSDIKKLVTWYNLLSKNNEELFVAEAKSEMSEKNDDKDAAEETS
ncbi:MAG: methylglyoxal synthase [Cyclobacteriaceae bacterium]|jgi:methylglyoxal synthase